MVTNAFGREFPLSGMLSCLPEEWDEEVAYLYSLCDKYDVCVHQVKIKFGSLRFYVGFAPQEVFDAIDIAEAVCYDEREVY